MMETMRGQVQPSSEQKGSGNTEQQQVQKTGRMIPLTQNLYLHSSPLRCPISTRSPGWICATGMSAHFHNGVTARIVINDTLELLNQVLLPVGMNWVERGQAAMILNIEELTDGREG